MDTITLLATDDVTVVFYPDENIVHHTILQPITGDSVRNMLNTSLTAMQQHHACKLLGDDRKNVGAVSKADEEWGNTEWFPAMLDAGWKFWAFVVPDDIATRMNMNEFVERYFQHGIRVMVFTNPEEAFDWLVKVDQA